MESVGAGWIVGDNAGRWRTFDSFGWTWTDRRDLAVRYARRADAELVHGEDNDAWCVECFTDAYTHPVKSDGAGVPEALRSLSERATPGPWSWEQCGEKEDVPVVGIAFAGDDPHCKAPYEGEFRDSDASRMAIAYNWHSCDGHPPSANAAFAVAAVNYVRAMLTAAPPPPAGTGEVERLREADRG